MINYPLLTAISEIILAIVLTAIAIIIIIDKGGKTQ